MDNTGIFILLLKCLFYISPTNSFCILVPPFINFIHETLGNMNKRVRLKKEETFYLIIFILNVHINVVQYIIATGMQMNFKRNEVL